jgi:hypothetical protein
LLGSGKDLIADDITKSGTPMERKHHISKEEAKERLRSYNLF